MCKLETNAYSKEKKMEKGCYVMMTMEQKESFFNACEKHNIFWRGTHKAGSMFEGLIKTEAYAKIADNIKPIYAISITGRYCNIMTILNDNDGILAKKFNISVGESATNNKFGEWHRN